MKRRGGIRARGLSGGAVAASLDAAAEAAGFRAGSFQPFADRLPQLLDATERLTYEGYEANGLGDLRADSSCATAIAG